MAVSLHAAAAERPGLLPGHEPHRGKRIHLVAGLPEGREGRWRIWRAHPVRVKPHNTDLTS